MMAPVPGEVISAEPDESPPGRAVGKVREAPPDRRAQAGPRPNHAREVGVVGMLGAVLGLGAFTRVRARIA